MASKTSETLQRVVSAATKHENDYRVLLDENTILLRQLEAALIGRDAWMERAKAVERERDEALEELDFVRAKMERAGMEAEEAKKRSARALEAVATMEVKNMWIEGRVENRRICRKRKAEEIHNDSNESSDLSARAKAPLSAPGRRISAEARTLPSPPASPKESTDTRVPHQHRLSSPFRCR
ncbi:hypothetical protein MKEN_00981700 [Mycena kentingensis (nom. inval.)]|nr:hypothetical protein MKEN_00981700 [Mycena kentingensis (nom. inval.)]